jgi:hypothetical protein
MEVKHQDFITSSEKLTIRESKETINDLCYHASRRAQFLEESKYYKTAIVPMSHIDRYKHG